MTSPLNHFGHEIGTVNIDGIIYKATVRYYDEDGNPLELSEEFEKQPCSISGIVKKQFDNYISATVEEHAKKVGKNLKEAQLIVINSDAITFDGVESKGHDFDLSEDTKKTLRQNLKEEIATVSKTWEKVHEILIKDFDAHITSASKPKLSFSAELNTQIKPHHAQLTLEKHEGKPLPLHVEPSAPPASPPPSYTEEEKEVLEKKSKEEPHVRDKKETIDTLTPIKEESSPVSEIHPIEKKSPIKPASPLVSIKEEKSDDIPEDSVHPTISPKSEILESKKSLTEIHPDSLSTSIKEEETEDITEDLAQAKSETPEVKKSLAELLSELNPEDLKILSSYLPYFHPLNWETVIKVFSALESLESKRSFIKNCEKVKQDIESHAQKAKPEIILATDENLLEQLPKHDRAIMEKYFKLIEKTPPKDLLNESEDSISQEILNQRRQKAKAELVTKYKDAKEKHLKALESQQEEDAPPTEIPLENHRQKLLELHKNQMDIFDKLNSKIAVNPVLDEAPGNPTPESAPQAESSSYLSYLNPFSWNLWKTPVKEEGSLESDIEQTPSKKTQDVKAPVIMIYDKDKDTYSVQTDNQENLTSDDIDVQARTHALKMINTKNAIEPAINHFLSSLQIKSTQNENISIDTLIQRYQLHIAVLQEEYKHQAELTSSVANMETYISFKSKLDTEFKTLILELLDKEIEDVPTLFQTTTNHKKTTISLTDEGKSYLETSLEKYLRVAKQLKQLGPSFHQINEDMLARNRSSSMIEIENYASAEKYLVSVLSKQTGKYSEAEHRKIIHETIKSIENAQKD